MPPVVSVIVLSYNHGEYMEESLDSVFSQDFKEEYEVIVVDDGSTDNSVEIAKKYPVRDVYEMGTNTKSWASVPLNYAVERAKAPWIVPLSTDDTFNPPYLSRVMEVVRLYTLSKTIKVGGKPIRIGIKDEKLGIVRIGMSTFGDEIPTTRYYPTPTLNLKRDMLVQNIVYGSSLFLKEAWKDVGGYSPIRLQDYDLWLKIIYKGYCVATADEPLYNHRIHKKAMTYDNFLYEKFTDEDNKEFFKLAIKYKDEIIKGKVNRGYIYTSLCNNIPGFQKSCIGG